MSIALSSLKPRSRLLAGRITVPRLRLASGLFLFFFVITHLLNHGLGMISLEAMEAGQRWFRWLWFNRPMDALLLLSAAVHLGLAVRSLYVRRTLRRMPPAEVWQLIGGLAIVPLIAGHILGTRIATQFFGANMEYGWVVAYLWTISPVDGAVQSIALVVAWGHGCIGLALWLRLQPWFARWRWGLFAAAIVIPLVALGGFASAGREAALLMRDEPAWQKALDRYRLPSAEVVEQLRAARWRIVFGSFAAIALILAARSGRDWVARRVGGFVVSYPGGRTSQGRRGMTILECSKAAGIPHASVCGGRGRCSTCRVRVDEGRQHLPPANPAEQRVLRRVGAPEDVRLACQSRPSGPVTVTPVLPPPDGTPAARAESLFSTGVETNIAVLFADIRGFTALSEQRLPYDVVFLLNRYFTAMGEAIEGSDGYLDKFVGDGIMALFGIRADRSGTGRTARSALAACHAMAQRLSALNTELSPTLSAPLRIGIGLHYGPAIVGEMGYGRTTGITAIGDTVNTASRLEALTKEHGTQLIVSGDLLEVAGLSGDDLPDAARHETALRGRSSTLSMWSVPDASRLPIDRLRG